MSMGCLVLNKTPCVQLAGKAEMRGLCQLNISFPLP